MQNLLFQTISLLFLFIQVKAQSVKQPQRDSILQIPSKYFYKVSAKANQLKQKLDVQSDKIIGQLKKREARMKKKLAKIDPLKANEVFGNIEQRYNDLEELLSVKKYDNQYIASLDTLVTTLKFFEQSPQLSQIKGLNEKTKETLAKVDVLEDKFQKAEEIKKFLKERNQYLKEQLSRAGFAKELKNLNKQVYYFSERLNEYKALLKDRKKVERKAIELLSRSKMFTDFMRRNSLLASLFRLPDDVQDPAQQINLAGLQTTTQVNNLIQQQLSTGGPNGQAQFLQNIRQAQDNLNHLKNKISESGGAGSDDMMPEGFKPNSQKPKSFLKRLELGVNTQTQKGNSFFPVTSDLGLSLGYKLNDKSIIGIAASYKLGWGHGWKHIQLTSEGAGLRSFIDCKLKASYWISGGFEMNYMTAFNRLNVLKDLSSWQQSGLVGVSKVVDVRSKFFKKTKLQLLWDFLSYKQVPRTQAVLMRITYNLN